MSSHATSSAVATCSADQPTNADRARACTRVDRRRALERLEEGPPVAGDRRQEHASRPVDHGRDADRVEGVADGRGVAVAADEDGDVSRDAPLRRDGPSPALGARRSRLRTTAGRRRRSARSAAMTRRAGSTEAHSLLRQRRRARRRDGARARATRRAPAHRSVVAAGGRRRRGRCGTRSRRGRAAPRPSTRRRRRSTPGRCAS